MSRDAEKRVRCLWVVFIAGLCCVGQRDVRAGDGKDAAPPGMVWIKGGDFDMGSDEPMFDDARPVHRVRVRGFWMDATEVTNAQFEEFVHAMGYVTLAERPLDPKQFPHLSEEERKPGSAVFAQPAADADLANPNWWRWVPGAN